MIEIVMADDGPRQRMLLYLGKLELNKENLKILAKLIERRLAGKHENVSYPDLEPLVVAEVKKYNDKIDQELKEKQESEAAVYVEIYLNSTNQTEYRSIG